jgi:hypothetical protein
VKFFENCRGFMEFPRAFGPLLSALALTWAGAAHADMPQAQGSVEPPIRQREQAVAAPLALADSLSPDARKEYDAARLLFQDGDYSGASAKFHLTFQLSGDPRLLWNQAVCEKEQRHYARATTLIERYLSEGARFVDEDKRRDAEALVEALRQFSSLVELRGAQRGALIEVDGELLGKAPLLSTLRLDLGRHTVRLEMPGFQPFVQVIEVPGATTVRVPVRMVREQIPSELSITVRPANATIRIDGVIVGEGTFIGPITPGTHNIQITAPGRATTERRLEVKKGQRQTLDVQLENTRTGKVWPWLVAGALVVAGGAAVGTVWAVNNGPVVGPAGSLGSVDARQK